jgi:hypothetical protein
MDGLGSAHLALVALWAGVVMVESTIEALGERGHIEIDAVARIHQATDRFIEVPTLIGVVITGLLLWARAGWSPELAPKIAFGAGAVAANLVTVVFVERRARGIGDPRRATLAIFAFGPVIVPCALAAVYLGGGSAGWW